MSVIVFADNVLAFVLLLPRRAPFDSPSASEMTFPSDCHSMRHARWLKASMVLDNFSSCARVWLWCAMSSLQGRQANMFFTVALLTGLSQQLLWKGWSVFIHVDDAPAHVMNQFFKFSAHTGRKYIFAYKNLNITQSNTIPYFGDSRGLNHSTVHWLF